MSPLDRRQFLTRSAAVLGSAGLGAVAGAVGEAQSRPSARSQSGSQATRASLADELATRISFDGEHQAGILTPAPANAQKQSTLVALDAIAPNRALLADALQSLSVRARALTQGDVVGEQEVDDPPPDSGILGADDAPDQLTVTIAFGASLFDGRYGLAAQRPQRLTAMPNFPNDELDPARSHGDVLVQICAGQRDTVVHTVRELMRATVGHLTPRWKIDGFQSAARGPKPHSSTRNLFAFRDGTANPDASDAELMDRLVWIDPSSHEPAWTHGGTYQVVRTIRMHVEFWDRVGMFEQQNMIGRDRVSGAPLGGSEEFEDPRYDLDPHGKRIPLDAHIRLANPRTANTEDQRIVRRGYNYDRGIDEAGDLDQGLVFVAFNQDIERQFATIQKRLDEEPMIDYITPVGGGYFFAPRGASGRGDWVGSGLFA
ncbi:MAG TPA: iron uptake transporter deferrochelatase/peroxidase subunit [Solirubrobacteraceae bacterium]|jgi:deferrochelatase/peroxidase EfeB|nr:iron uptake transporter deferrochelatase/peroxidase subunit [Solirubrobacteraceae bacterium]